MTRKRICFQAGAIVAVTMFLVVTATARADPFAGTDEVAFRAQGLPHPSDSGVTAVAARAVLRAFYGEYPNYRIDPFSMPAMGTAAGDGGVLMAIAAGVGPHAISVNFRQSSTYIERGFLEPMEVLLARVLSADETVRQTGPDGKWVNGPGPEETLTARDLLRERVPEPAWPVIYRRNDADPAGEEHVWALPYTNLVRALLYRKDLFSQAGLDPERPPKDWDELLVYARALREPEEGRMGLMLAYSASVLYSFLVSNGVEVMRQEDGEWRASYDSREAAEAFYYVWRLMHEPWERDGRMLRNAASRTYDLLEWERGRIGMYFAYLDEEMIATINPQLVGIAPVPASPRGMAAGEVNALMLGVFSDSSPQEKLAVMRYLWFLTGEEARKIRTRVYVENGYGQFVNPDLLEKFGYHDLLAQVPAGWKDTFEAAMADGVPEPYGRNTQNIYRYMARPIYQALELPMEGMDKEAAIGAIHAILAESVDEVNRKVLGHVDPELKRKQRVIAGLVMLLIAIGFMAGLWHVWRYFSLAAAAPAGGPGRARVPGYVLLLPALTLILLWQYFPLFGGLLISVADYQLVRETAWVGVDNFATVLFDERFWAALGRTLYFVALMIGFGFWPPILLAILLQEIPTKTAKYVYRTIFYLPAVISGIVVMFLWKQFYDPSESGALNQLLLALNRIGPFPATALKLFGLALWVSLIAMLLNLPRKVEEMPGLLKAAFYAAGAALVFLSLAPVFRAGAEGSILALAGSLFGRFENEALGWIHDPSWAMLCVVIPTIWAASGPACIIYLAALKTVPEELYEAADIDGAGNWHKVFYIVLPRLKFIIVIQFVAAVVAAFRGGAEYILALTDGGPNDATTILSLEILFRTFMDLRFGLGTAMAWILGLILIGFTAWQLKMLSRAEFRAGG